MNLLGAILAILNIATILGPIAGVAIMYQSNLEEMVIPPQLQDIMSGGGGGDTALSGLSLQMPHFVNAVADTAARSVTIYLNFSNPFNIDLNLYSISADVVCQEHNFTLGHAELLQSTVLEANQTSNLAVVCHWTLEAENHFASQHQGASGVDVNVIGLSIDVNDLHVKSGESYAIPNLPISTNIAPPTYLYSVTNLTNRSATIAFSFSNPTSYDLHMTSVSADILCSAHEFLLGQASLVNSVTIPASGRADFQILCQWSQNAENHFASEHPNAASIDVDVVGLTVNVNDITIQAPSSYHVPNVPLS